MECQKELCKHYELWDSSYEDDKLGYQECIVEFCHYCENIHDCKKCRKTTGCSALSDNWEGYSEHKCKYKFEPIENDTHQQ